MVLQSKKQCYPALDLKFKLKHEIKSIPLKITVLFDILIYHTLHYYLHTRKLLTLDPHVSSETGLSEDIQLKDMSAKSWS